MTRREFLAVMAGVATGATALAVVVRSGWQSERFRRSLRRLEGFGRSPAARLRSHYAWLAVEPAAFDSYIRDYERYFKRLDRFSIPDPDFFTRFLLSTNFFMNGGSHVRNGERVSYSVFYEPSVSPCYNPLASRPPSDTELALAHGGTLPSA